MEPAHSGEGNWGHDRGLGRGVLKPIHLLLMWTASWMQIDGGAPPTVQEDVREFRLIRVEPDGIYRFAPSWKRPHYPCIALALSGGGAKGFVHVGVLYGIEEHGVRIDEIAGTSMGALVGGLFACGIPPWAIEQHLSSVNFSQLFFDQRLRDPSLSLPEQVRQAEGLWEFHFKRGQWQARGGLLRGDTLDAALSRWFARASLLSGEGSLALPIPFTPVAVDLKEGRVVYLRSEKLATAIRASMTVPSGLDPVHFEDMILVDGGVLENLPTRALQDRPHDILIASDIGERLQPPKKDYSIFSVVDRVQEILFAQQRESLEALADHIIRPDLGNWSFANFDKDFQEMVRRGWAEFNRVWPEIERDIQNHIKQRDEIFRLESFEIVGIDDPQQRQWCLECFQHDANHIALTDLENGLQQVLDSGWYDDAVVTQKGKEFTLRVFPYGSVTQIEFLPGTEAFPEVRQVFRDRFLGRPFNHKFFQDALVALIPEELSQADLFSDLRGTRFDSETGTLHISFQRLAVDAIEVRGNDEPTTALLTKRFEERWLGQTVNLRHLQDFADRMADRNNLESIDYYPVNGSSPSTVKLLVEYRVSGHQMVSVSYAYETNVEHDFSLLYLIEAIPPVATDFRLRVQHNRFLSEAQVDCSTETLWDSDLGVHVRANVRDLDFANDLAPEFVVPAEESRGWSAAIGLFKRFKSTGIAQCAYGLNRLDTTLSPEVFGEDADQHPPERFHRFSFDVAWDSFDHFVLPTRGSSFRFRGESYRDDRTHWRGLMSYCHILPLTENQWFSFQSLVGGNDDDVRPDQWFMVGGPEFFYGTEAMEFTVPNFMTLRLEYQAKVASIFGYDFMASIGLDYGTDAFSFADLWRDFSTVGYGVSLKTYGNFRHLGISYGRNPDLGSSVSLLFGPKPFSLWRHN